jgi:micrococcal nuclease
MVKNGIIIVLTIVCVALGSYFILTKQAVVRQNSIATDKIVPREVLKEQYRGRVINVLDGDSITLRDDNKQQLNVRLGEIDAPEYDQPFGGQARQVLTDLVLGKKVIVKSQVIDKYGRIVGRVYLDEIDVSAELVRSGSAWVYRKYATDNNLYQLEDKAKQDKLGLWNLLEIERIPPWEWRHNKQNVPLAK